MDYEQKREIEEVFESYLQAMERQDQQAMENAWRQSPDDQMYSVFGKFTGKEIVHQLMEDVLPVQIKTLRTGKFTMQELTSTESTAMMQVEYEAAADLAKEDRTAMRTVLESQMYEKTPEGWKLAYVHQSWMPEPAILYEENRMEQALAGMLAWMNAKSGQDIPIPKTTIGCIRLLQDRLKDWNLDPDEAYLNDQEIFLQERKRLRNLEIIPMQPSADPAVQMQEASLIAAEAIIGFLDKEQSYDPFLSLDAGIELQRDIAMIQAIKPRSVLTLDGFHLPVKGIIEIAERPVYGLLTKAKKKTISDAFRLALQSAVDLGYKSLVIHAGWHQGLNLPLDFAKTMLEILQEFPAGSFDSVVFQVSRTDERKALESALASFQQPLLMEAESAD